MSLRPKHDVKLLCPIAFNLMTTAELPDEWKEYYKAKARDLPEPKQSTINDLLNVLDTATINALNNGGSHAKVNEAFNDVLNHPDSTWTTEVLNYRQRQLHYK